MNHFDSLGIVKPRVAVIIPAYKVRDSIVGVVEQIGSEVDTIIVIDDGCPQDTGNYLRKHSSDPRLTILTHAENRGVGGAMKTGYQYGLSLDLDIFVKLDGDGQMDSNRIKTLIKPLVDRFADYSKGNRFFSVEQIHLMPKKRILGNIILSFFSKISSGYWNIFDPNNGFTAINRLALERISIEKLSERYFFESDMLFRLNLARAVVVDIAMPPIYGDEVSNLSIKRTLFEFPLKHTRNFMKRLIYSYGLRDFSVASLEIIIGTILILFSSVYGIYNLQHSYYLDQPTEVGTLILIAMSFLSGLQLLLSFLAFDIENVPRTPISKFE